jgi:hypothetical protein
MGGDRCFQLATIHQDLGIIVDPGADHRLEFNQAGADQARAPPGLRVIFGLNERQAIAPPLALIRID